MDERDLPLSDLKELAEDELDERRREVGGEEQARELLDIPTETPGRLVREQEQE